MLKMKLIVAILVGIALPIPLFAASIFGETPHIIREKGFGPVPSLLEILRNSPNATTVKPSEKKSIFGKTPSLFAGREKAFGPVPKYTQRASRGDKTGFTERRRNESGIFGPIPNLFANILN